MLSRLFNRVRAAQPDSPPPLRSLLRSASIEVLPKTLAAIPDIDRLLPQDTRVYIAHIEGTPIDDMVAAAGRLSQNGLIPMPHIPARLIRDRHELEEWLTRYSQAGVSQALVLGGGRRTPVGELESAMQLLETGLFERLGFQRLHVAGHPEGNADMDPDRSGRMAMQALRWKQRYARSTGAAMAIVTQFVFEADPVMQWVHSLRAADIEMPVHIGMAGPAKLTTLLKYAATCGIGNSVRVLQKRARDITKLALPFEPTELATELARRIEASPGLGIEALHFFPLGGIRRSVEWIEQHRGGPDR